MDMQLHSGKEHIPNGQVDVPTVPQLRAQEGRGSAPLCSPAQGPGRKGLAGLTSPGQVIPSPGEIQSSPY